MEGAVNEGMDNGMFWFRRWVSKRNGYGKVDDRTWKASAGGVSRIEMFLFTRAAECEKLFRADGWPRNVRRDVKAERSLVGIRTATTR